MEILYLVRAQQVASDFGFVLATSDLERGSAFWDGPGTQPCRDSSIAALWLSLCFADPGLGCVLNVVAGIRMSRLVRWQTCVGLFSRSLTATAP